MTAGGDELLLRIWRRRTSLEEDAETIRIVEFEDEHGQPDLSPSVYAIKPTEVVQVVTEHFAGNGLDTVKNQKEGHVDLRGLCEGQVRSTPGTHWFKRACEAHRELTFADEGELLEMIRHLRECGRYPYEKRQAKAYIQGRVEAEDQERLHFLRSHRHGRRYAKFAGVVIG